MSAFSITLSLRSRKRLRVAAWGALIVAILAILAILAIMPSVAHVSRHLANWFMSLSLHPSRLWKESPWSY